MIAIARQRSGGRPIWESVARVATDLGIADLVDAQYYEIRLGESQEQIDYLPAFSRAAAPHLRARLRERAGPRQRSDGSRWRLLAALVEAWADGHSWISLRVPTVWLEFDDLHNVEADDAVPSVSVCLVPGYRCDRPIAWRDPEGDRRTLHEVLTALGFERTQDLDLALDDVFAHLPPDGRWIHLSVMLGREPCAVKLYGSMLRHDLLPYLRKIGWCGDVQVISSILEGVYSPRLVGEEVFVDLNLDTFRDPARCSLGLAAGQQHAHRDPARDASRGRLLDRWVEDGLCAPAKRESLRGWPPASNRSAFLDLKVVWQRHAGLTGKAYLGCSP